MSTDEVAVFKANLDQRLAAREPITEFLASYHKQLRSVGLPEDICYELVVQEAARLEDSKSDSDEDA